jgi:DNA modification methylase
MNGYPGHAWSGGESISRKTQHARQRKPGGYGKADKRTKPLDMMGAPWTLAFALRARGWFLRADVIWAKIAVMPSSTDGWRWEQHTTGTGDNRRNCPGCEKCKKDGGLVLRRGSWKPTPSHEYIFQLAKEEQYFADPLAVRQLPAKASLDRIRQPNFWAQEGGSKDARVEDPNTDRSARNGLENFARNPGRNLWDVWAIPPTPLSEKHFATFPAGLPELAIRASVSQGGYCSACGSPFARIVEMDIHATDNPDWETTSKIAEDPEAASHRTASRTAKLRQEGRDHDNPFPVKRTLGWKATCKCGTGVQQSGIVLDPFSGSGTTVRVANALGLRGFGFDVNIAYTEMAYRLINDIRLIMEDSHDKTEITQYNLFD